MGHCCHYGPFRYVPVAFPRLPGVLAANLRFRHQKKPEIQDPEVLCTFSKGFVKKTLWFWTTRFSGKFGSPHKASPRPRGGGENSHSVVQKQIWNDNYIKMNTKKWQKQPEGLPKIDRATFHCLLEGAKV